MHAKAKATIKDIAKIAGVSHSTVSRSLSGHPRISLETRERIQAIAKELNYTPNLTAQSLKLQKSFHIGIFLTSIMEGTTSSFFHQTLKGCNRALIDSPYNVVVKGIEDYHGDYSSVNSNHFDGIVVVSQSELEDPFIAYLASQDIPHIVINRKVDYAHNLLCNEKKGAYLATQHLIELGHKQIGFIRGKADFANAHERESGFRRALAESGLVVKPSHVAQGDFSMRSGYRAMLEILDGCGILRTVEQEGGSVDRNVMRGQILATQDTAPATQDAALVQGRVATQSNIPTAIFASCDEMAIGAMKALQERGIKVPEQCSIIGFDNTPMCEFTSPRLSSVARPIDTMLFEATTLLIDLINSPKKERKDTGTRYLCCSVAKRESTQQVNCEFQGSSKVNPAKPVRTTSHNTTKEKSL